MPRFHFPGTARSKERSAPLWSTAQDDEIDWDAVKKPTKEELGEAWAQAISRYQLQTATPGIPVIDESLVPKASQKTLKAYRDICNHDIHGARIYGRPGSGLAGSGFGKTEVRTGTKGEEIFAKLLTWDGILDHCVSFWSVWNPEADGHRNTRGTDIDCILMFGSHILLVDVKNYRAGIDYHSLVPGKAMFCMYPKARVVAHEPYIFSANMAFAQHNLSTYLRVNGSSSTVESFVVLVPASTGEAKLDSDISWPGDIHAMAYSDFVGMMKQRALDDPSYINFKPEKTKEEGYLASLVKSYGEVPLCPLEAPTDQNQWPIPVYDKLAGIAPKGAKEKQPRRHYQSRHLDKSNSPAKKPTGFIGKIPAFNLSKGSIACLSDKSGSLRYLNLKDTGGLLAAGEHGSGSVVCMTSIMASLVASRKVDLRIIDCNGTSNFERFTDYVTSYTHLSDGIDLVCSEIQEVYTAIRSRQITMRKSGLDDYWQAADDCPFGFQVLFINECSRLFANPHMPKNDQTYLDDIKRYLQTIAKKGAKVGICVIILTQKPSVKALPANLTQACNLRVCFRVARVATRKLILGSDLQKKVSFDPNPRSDIGMAYLRRGRQKPIKLQFLRARPEVMDTAYPY